MARENGRQSSGARYRPYGTPNVTTRSMARQGIAHQASGSGNAVPNAQVGIGNPAIAVPANLPAPNLPAHNLAPNVQLGIPAIVGPAAPIIAIQGEPGHIQQVIQPPFNIIQNHGNHVILQAVNDNIPHLIVIDVPSFQQIMPIPGHFGFQIGQAGAGAQPGVPGQGNPAGGGPGGNGHGGGPGGGFPGGAGGAGQGGQNANGGGPAGGNGGAPGGGGPGGGGPGGGEPGGGGPGGGGPGGGGPGGGAPGGGGPGGGGPGGGGPVGGGPGGGGPGGGAPGGGGPGGGGPGGAGPAGGGPGGDGPENYLIVSHNIPPYFQGEGRRYLICEHLMLLHNNDRRSAMVLLIVFYGCKAEIRHLCNTENRLRESMTEIYSRILPPFNLFGPQVADVHLYPKCFFIGDHRLGFTTPDLIAIWDLDKKAEFVLQYVTDSREPFAYIEIDEEEKEMYTVKVGGNHRAPVALRIEIAKNQTKGKSKMTRTGTTVFRVHSRPIGYNNPLGISIIYYNEAKQLMAQTRNGGRFLFMYQRNDPATSHWVRIDNPDQTLYIVLQNMTFEPAPFQD